MTGVSEDWHEQGAGEGEGEEGGAGGRECAEDRQAVTNLEGAPSTFATRHHAHTQLPPWEQQCGAGEEDGGGGAGTFAADIW